MFKYKCGADRLDKDELCAVDSTTRSAYGSSLADIKWGRNKERVPLPQTSEVVVYSLDSHMPVYYGTFPGNIPDSRSVETILTDISHAGFPRVILVTDEGLRIGSEPREVHPPRPADDNVRQDAPEDCP